MPSSKLFSTCLIIGTREQSSSQLTLYSSTVMWMLILQDCTIAILIPALQVPSLDSATSSRSPLGGVPLVWHSQLQSEISLSTLKSEYSSLSQAMHARLPICSLLIEVVPAIGLQEALAFLPQLCKSLRGRQWSLATCWLQINIFPIA
jgi:hypothetical protein